MAVRRRPLSVVLLTLLLVAVPCTSFLSPLPPSWSIPTHSFSTSLGASIHTTKKLTKKPVSTSPKKLVRPHKSDTSAAAKIGAPSQSSNGISPPLKARRASTSTTPEPFLQVLPTTSPNYPVSFDERWNHRYEELEAYKRLHGDCLVPQSYPPNPALGRWVRAQRINLRYLQKGEGSRITPDRVARLDALGFVWDAQEATWWVRLGELRAYKAEHGHCHVPQNDEERKKLAFWVRNQRMHHTYVQRGRKKALTPERIEALDELGFMWDAHEASWMEKFEMLRKFRGEHGHCNVPSQYKENIALARWILQIRVQMKELKEHKEKEGDRTNNAGDAASIGDNGTKKKRGRKQTRLTQKRIDLLNSVDFVWNPHDFYWWERYNELKAYKEEQGHCSVPARYAPNPKLGNWVNNQRGICSHYANAALAAGATGADRVPLLGLSEERLEAFRAIDFCYLPSAEDIADAALKASQAQTVAEEPKESPTVQTAKPQVKQAEKKAFIPFPWDEI